MDETRLRGYTLGMKKMIAAAVIFACALFFDPAVEAARNSSSGGVSANQTGTQYGKTRQSTHATKGGQATAESGDSGGARIGGGDPTDATSTQNSSSDGGGVGSELEQEEGVADDGAGTGLPGGAFSGAIDNEDQEAQDWPVTCKGGQECPEGTIPDKNGNPIAGQVMSPDDLKKAKTDAKFWRKRCLEETRDMLRILRAVGSLSRSYKGYTLGSYFAEIRVPMRANRYRAAYMYRRLDRTLNCVGKRPKGKGEDRRYYVSKACYDEGLFRNTLVQIGEELEGFEDSVRAARDGKTGDLPHETVPGTRPPKECNDQTAPCFQHAQVTFNALIPAVATVRANWERVDGKKERVNPRGN